MSKQDQIKTLTAFALGLHSRLGETSPVQLIGCLPTQMIAEMVCEESHLIEQMLNDYYRDSQQFPADEGEFMWDLERMQQTYLTNPSPSSQFVLDQYAHGHPVTYKTYTCDDCGVNGYSIDMSGHKSVCANCHSEEITVEDTTEPTPPWTDVETFYWEEYDMPDPDTYADAYAMYGGDYHTPTSHTDTYPYDFDYSDDD